MKLGAQLFSLRNFLQTEEGTMAVFRACKDMGYESIQYSGKVIATNEDAALIRRATEEANIELANTSFGAQEIMDDPKAVIEKMDMMGSRYTMVGAMPKEYRGSREGTEQFLKDMETPTKILLDAGKIITYHNHAYEFAPLSDANGITMEILVGSDMGWQFMLDVCWAVHGGADPLKLMDAMGADRLHQVHFKDMVTEKTEKGNPIFCPCGKGIVDLTSFYEKCRAFGVQHGFVEQDNAATLPDPLDEMAQSCRYLRTLMGKDG